MGLDELDDPLHRVTGQDLAGRVVRRRQRHQPRSGPEETGQPVDVERPAVLVAQVEEADAGADRPRRLEVGSVVRPDHHELVARSEKRAVDDEQRGRGARGHEHVVRSASGGVRGDGRSQPRTAAVVAVLEDQVLELDTELAQRRVGDGALGEVGPDPGVAELLGGLGLDRHPSVVHAPRPRVRSTRSGRRRQRPVTSGRARAAASSTASTWVWYGSSFSIDSAPS